MAPRKKKSSKDDDSSNNFSNESTSAGIAAALVPAAAEAPLSSTPPKKPKKNMPFQESNNKNNSSPRSAPKGHQEKKGAKRVREVVEEDNGDEEEEEESIVIDAYDDDRDGGVEEEEEDFASESSATHPAKKRGKNEEQEGALEKPKQRRLRVPLKLFLESPDLQGEAPPDAAAGVEDLVGSALRASKVIAPDYSGVRCLAVHPEETEVVVARENGSMMRLEVRYFQNIPHFVVVRHTGGCRRHTIMSLHYWIPAATTSSHPVPPLLVGTYLSGQVVIFDAHQLFPIHVHQRSGGALWGSCMIGQTGRLLTAVADGSWQQLRLVASRNRSADEHHREDEALLKLHVELERIVPRVPGADRALSVHCETKSLRIAAGTDDAGNVVAWRLSDALFAAPEGGEEEEQRQGGGGGYVSGLGQHVTLWTTTLTKGIGLCCCVCSGGGVGRPVVAVGSTAGEVVLLDATHGHICHVFSQHRGPVSSIISSVDQTTLYATGWHELLRSYRCDAGDAEKPAGGGGRGAGDAAWFPAEVKRRTHYHEATQLATLPQHQLLFSASRDGTVMYAPLHQLFTAPANYVHLSTQQFAYAAKRNVLLHTRYGRVEAFYPDSAYRHWCPLFAYASHGKFHLTGLWCDRGLDAIVFTTDERIVLLRVLWKRHPDRALRQIQHRFSISAGRGVLDVLFHNPLEEEEEEDIHNRSAANKDEDGDDEEREIRVFILQDKGILQVTTTPGAPHLFTSFAATIQKSVDESTHATSPQPQHTFEFSKLFLATAPCGGAKQPPHRTCIDEEKEDDKDDDNANEEEAGNEKKKKRSGASRRRRARNDAEGATAHRLIASGPSGAVSYAILPDGSLDGSSAMYVSSKVYRLPRAISYLRPPVLTQEEEEGAAAGPASSSSSPSSSSSSSQPHFFCCFSTAANRYVCGEGVWNHILPSGFHHHHHSDPRPASPSSTGDGAAATTTSSTNTLSSHGVRLVHQLPASLPHDVVFVGRLDPSLHPRFSSLFEPRVRAGMNRNKATQQAEAGQGTSASTTTTTKVPSTPSVILVGYFSRGVLVCTDREWRMLHRSNIDFACFLEKTGQMLFLERNLEKTLESMPLCWKVKRFGN